LNDPQPIPKDIDYAGHGIYPNIISDCTHKNTLLEAAVEEFLF
jgi:hypothetical protein